MDSGEPFHLAQSDCSSLGAALSCPPSRLPPHLHLMALRLPLALMQYQGPCSSTRIFFQENGTNSPRAFLSRLGISPRYYANESGDDYTGLRKIVLHG